MSTDMAQSFYMLERSDGRVVCTNRSMYIYNEDHSRETPESFYNTDLNWKGLRREVENWVRGNPRPDGTVICSQAHQDKCSTALYDNFRSIVVLEGSLP